MIQTRARLVGALRQLLDASAGAGERCELCGARLPGEHAHLVDVRTRRLVCACATCGGSIGPSSPDAAAAPLERGGGDCYGAIPRRYIHRPSMVISPDDWETLGIPVGLAFFCHNTRLGRTVACYPGPAGAMESVLPLDAWPALVEAYPWMGDAAPDTEALLVRRSEAGYACFIVPIDACYELVGRIRRTWTGFDGGEPVRNEVDAFFGAVLRRSADEDQGTEGSSAPARGGGT